VYSDLRKSDSGLYTCKATSETGQSTWNAFLVVETSSNPRTIFHRTPEPSAFPGPPSRPDVTDVTDTSVQLSWRANSNHGASPVVAFTVEYFSHETGQVGLNNYVGLYSFKIYYLRPFLHYAPNFTVYLLCFNAFYFIYVTGQVSMSLHTAGGH